MFSSTFPAPSFIVNRKANEKKKKKAQLSRARYNTPVSILVRDWKRSLSCRVKIPRTSSRSLYPIYIYRERTTGCIREKSRKRCKVVQYKINRSFKYKRAALDKYISSGRWTRYPPRLSNSRSSLACTKTTIQCPGVVYSISHIYISWYIHMRKIDGSYDGQSESGR